MSEPDWNGLGKGLARWALTAAALALKAIITKLSSFEREED